MAEPRGTARVTFLVNAAGNFLGAAVAFLYFRLVDQHAATLPRVSLHDLVHPLLVFAALLVVGNWLNHRWVAPINRATQGHPLSERDAALVRRRALLFPYVLAGVTFAGWVVAGLIWGFGMPYMMGRDVSLSDGVRIVFGITVLAGSATTAFIFFVSERDLADAAALLFPEGDLSAVPRVPRLAVRVRLLAIFLLTAVVPLAMLGIVAYARGLDLLDADPATARGIVSGLRSTVLFFVGVGVVVAVGLALFAANSSPTAEDVEAAMARVERGRLDGRAPVVSTNEIGVVAEGFNRMLHGLRERELVKETFGKYVTPEIRDEILAGRVAASGQLMEVTILFADLRDFTPWVEATARATSSGTSTSTSPDGPRPSARHRGLVLQFIGDEIEAVFGAPIAARDHAGLAVRAALEMRQRLPLERGRETAGGPPPHGIGIHTGTVLAGNIGGAERLSYALVGDPVNLASRIQGLTKDFEVDILVSGATRKRLAPAVPG